MHRARCYQVFQQSWWFDSECEFSERATACCMLLLLPMLRWMKDVLLRLDGRNSHSFSFSSLLFFPVLLWESSWALFWHNIQPSQHLQSQKSKRTTQTKRYCNRSWRAVSYPSFVFLTAVARSVCMPSAGGCLKKGGMGIFTQLRVLESVPIIYLMFFVFFLALLLLLRVFLIMLWLVHKVKFLHTLDFEALLMSLSKSFSQQATNTTSNPNSWATM